jgi:NAD(P)-dependent dehydrogenase (short-subunit alcohol dehydrogenase family)
MSRVWLITGGNSGFGRAITEAAVSAGDVVVATSRRTATLDDLAGAYPDQVEVLPLDVFGPAALVRAVLPLMRARRSGAIVQLSSMGGQLSFAGFAAYSATKFALEGMSEALAEEVRPLGIKVLIVEPGAFRTALFSNISASAQIADYAATVGPTRHMIETGNGTQPGDPARAAAAILTALDSEATPLRLPLGDDAVDAILGRLDSVRAEITTWEKVARDTRLAE